MNPFGTDADTLRYAAGQVMLPALAIQLRRIADTLDRGGLRAATRAEKIIRPGVYVVAAKEKR